jgi:hypothetical protein
VKETAGAAGSSVARAEKIEEKYETVKNSPENIFFYVKRRLNHL